MSMGLMRVVVIAIFTVLMGVGMFPPWLRIDFGDLSFFLEQIKDLGVEYLFLNLVDGAVIFELLS